MNNDGGPAFPHLHESSQRINVSEYHGGMTLRDYFAAAALQGWLASFSFNQRHPVADGIGERVAKEAYLMADAMLAEREK